MPWRDVGLLCLPAAVFAVDLMLWHRSIVITGPGLATLLANFQVFVMALAGVLLFGERLGARFLVGLGFAFGGLWLLVGRDWGALAGDYRWGVWLGLGAGVAYAAYILLMRDAQRRQQVAGSEQALCAMSLLCAVVLGAAVVAEGHSFAIPDLQSWWALIGLGLTGQVLGWVLIGRALPQLPASTVGLLLLMQPVLSFVLDVLLFARPTVAWDWIGVLASLAGIFFASTKGPPVRAGPAVST
jgi:drug/metabolite transporter (DMT)-like permease